VRDRVKEVSSDVTIIAITVQSQRWTTIAVASLVKKGQARKEEEAAAPQLRPNLHVERSYS
jgi:hypothetical protein